MSSTTFTFRAIDLGGAQSQGEVEAESKQVVADQLKARGLIVLDIASKRGSKEIELPWANRIKLGDLAIMTRQLSTMVSSGMTILRALYVLEAQTENKKLGAVLMKVRKDVEAGLPLSDALERHPKVFNPLFASMARAGETGGVLDSALIRVADQLEKEESLRRQVKSAMVYPGVIMGFAALVLLILVAFLVPVFEGVFAQFGGDLPAITKFTVLLSDLVTGRWYLMLAGTAGLTFAFLRWKRSPAGRATWERFMLRIPFKIGDTVQKIALARWSVSYTHLTLPTIHPV